MSPLLFLVVALAGGVGAAARFALDSAIRSATARRRLGAALPWGTLAINLSGSLLLGVLVGAVGAGALGGEWQWALGAGFLGGFTTFSTASFETVRMLQQRRWAAGLVNGLLQLVVATALAGASRLGAHSAGRAGLGVLGWACSAGRARLDARDCTRCGHATSW
jgi:CrcB protein